MRDCAWNHHNFGTVGCEFRLSLELQAVVVELIGHLEPYQCKQ